MTEKYLCENCHTQKATFTVTENINNQPRNMLLCEECKNKLFPENPFGGFLDSISNIFGDNNDPILSNFGKPSSNNTDAVLKKFCTNLNDLALTDKISPLIGRDREIDEVIFVLNKRKKNNPVLIGEPGVGKTAIAEGIAKKIVEGSVPDSLKNKIIYSLNLTSLVSGTSYRGQFEKNVESVLNAVKANSNIILFIDELHMIMGAGAVKDSDDFANMIKPALSNGTLQIIGATTLKEFNEIEKDGAMERRLQKIIVGEPTNEETLSILKGIKNLYETHYGVRYSEKTLETIVKLADRYIFYRNMPDKAIDLLDAVGSIVNIRGLSDSEKDLATQTFLKLQEEEKKARETNNYRRAYEKLRELKELENTRDFNTPNAINITIDDVKLTIEKLTNIPIADIDVEGKEFLTKLDASLSEKVIGQEDAIKKISKAIKRNTVNIRKSKSPSSFLLAGPTGVGKTELAKTIASTVFKTDNSLVRYDMSEFMEEHSVSKLIGAPPGYVGHEDGGSLTDTIKNNPYCVILFDEIEKAHPKVFNIFLQVLDDGILTDAKGKKVDFSNAIIMFTSNVGTTSLKMSGFIAESPQAHFESAVKDHFRPEFINRLNAIVPFSHLEKESLNKIFENLVAPILEGIEEYQFKLTIPQATKEWIIDKGYSKEYGARFLNRAIIEHVEDVVTDYILTNKTLKDVKLVLSSDKKETLLQPIVNSAPVVASLEQEKI